MRCLWHTRTVSTISFAKDVKATTTGVRTVLIVAPKSVFTAARFPKGLGKRLTDMAIQLARDAVPGDLGATASTLTRGKPERLAVGVLPDKPSRYNSPARAESVRRVCAAANLARRGGTGVLLILDEPDHLLAGANAVARAMPLYSSKTSRKSTARVKIGAIDHSGAAVAADDVVQETVGASRVAAELVDTPPTEMHPGALAAAAKRLLGDVAHVSVKEIVGPKLLTHKLGGIHAVGRCAVEPPRLLVASYAPRGAAAPRVALVGKGITYDTGGLHLKARGSMESMKCDMGGAAATLGAFRVLAASGIQRRIDLVLCLAENAIGPVAYKPDDIITMHSGKTVEINNTDAEGRMVLADGVSYAARVLGANVIIDAATLTGAQMIATGALHAAVVSNDAGLEQVALDAGTASGDLTHPLPFAPEFYKQEFASPVADMRNSVKNRANAQSSCAAQFIWWHIDNQRVRWCHVDLAGPAWRFNRGTGYGVALLSEMVRQL